MKGCTDGTFNATGQKFFDCPSGKGLYYPLGKVQPDARYTEVAVDGNREKLNSYACILFMLLYLV